MKLHQDAPEYAPKNQSKQKRKNQPSTPVERPSRSFQNPILDEENLNEPNAELASDAEESTTSKSAKTSKHERKTSKKSRNPLTPRQKALRISLCIILILVAAGTGVLSFFAYQSYLTDINFAAGKTDEYVEPPHYYSTLTGEEITDESANESPAFCIQIPNGVDGGRPQVGLNQAGVIFEAIAEAGITRFAAIFQNPTSAAIGPIRSLRPYYLSWDTPFDCTITHAGGSGEALAAIEGTYTNLLGETRKYSNLDENTTTMYRVNGTGRLWNNLFTTSAYLKSFNSATSHIKSFDRLDIFGQEDQLTAILAQKSAAETESATTESDATTTESTESTEADTETATETTPTYTLASEIYLDLSTANSFNVHYTYNPETNSYDRYYFNGTAHEAYVCPDDDTLGAEITPETSCTLAQLSPKVVIAISVQESKMADNYHENITTLGSGTAYIFQNGAVFAATWHKATDEDQLTFTDADGNTISLAPGQTWITAVPNYGSITFE